MAWSAVWAGAVRANRVAKPTAVTALSCVARQVRRERRRSPAERVAFQTKVSAFVGNSADLTVQGVISGGSLRLSMSPVFNTVNGLNTTPVVNNPLLPGSPSGKVP